MPGESTPIITLLTDFGHGDPWVGSMKGVLWSIQPGCRIVDLSHSVPPHDVFGGAFTLYRTFRDFPSRTIHVCVVDPGVGGPRRPLLVVTGDHYFVGPDNGVFSFIYRYGDLSRVIAVTAEHYFRRPTSQTFHGRDVFAPVAGWLSRGIDASRFGEDIDDYVTIPVPEDKVVGDNLIQGEICCVDRFGNLITNIRRETLDDLSERTGKKRFKVLVAGQEAPFVTTGYGQETALFALVNSAELVEIAAPRSSAAQALGIFGRGREVSIMCF